MPAWIYKTFNEGDPAFAEWLHSHGYTASFQCLSPIVLSRAQEEHGKLKAKYLSPEDDGYQQQLINNLIQRYQTAVMNEKMVKW